jgi:hypothetical protein
LVEAGVKPAGPGIDEPGQRIDVGRLELRDLSVPQDALDDRMLVGQGFEDCRVGRVAGLGFLRGFQPQPVVQNRPKLRR